MSPLVLLATKVALAGLLVALLSHLSSALKPKMFAGLFAGAPTVATVSLLLTGIEKPAAAEQGAIAMILGAIGMVACCTVASLLVPRFHAMAATAAGWVAWAAVTLAVFFLVLR